MSFFGRVIFFLISRLVLELFGSNVCLPRFSRLKRRPRQLKGSRRRRRRNRKRRTRRTGRTSKVGDQFVSLENLFHHFSFQHFKNRTKKKRALVCNIKSQEDAEDAAASDSDSVSLSPLDFETLQTPGSPVAVPGTPKVPKAPTPKAAPKAPKVLKAPKVKAVKPVKVGKAGSDAAKGKRTPLFSQTARWKVKKDGTDAEPTGHEVRSSEKKPSSFHYVSGRGQRLQDDTPLREVMKTRQLEAEAREQTRSNKQILYGIESTLSKFVQHTIVQQAKHEILAKHGYLSCKIRVQKDKVNPSLKADLFDFVETLGAKLVDDKSGSTSPALRPAPAAVEPEAMETEAKVEEAEDKETKEVETHEATEAKENQGADSEAKAEAQGKDTEGQEETKGAEGKEETKESKEENEESKPESTAEAKKETEETKETKVDAPPPKTLAAMAHGGYVTLLNLSNSQKPTCYSLFLFGCLIVDVWIVDV